MRNPMDEQWLKNNTDCVYFLASPLTCKKGLECEYRHSEYARLNPVDCWYWLSGNCLNDNCAFRHPPLDGLPEESLDSANMYQQIPAAVTKSNIPCRFFLSGYCNKGENCLFLHVPSDYDDIPEPMEIVSEVMNKPVIDKNIAVSEGISSDAPVITHASPAIIYRRAIGKAMGTEGETKSAIPVAIHAIHANPSVNTNRTDFNSKMVMGIDRRHVAPDIADVDPSKNYRQKRVGIYVKPEVDILQSTAQSISRYIPNQQSSGLLIQENVTHRLNPTLYSRKITQRTSQAEQRSGDQVEDNSNTKPEKWGSSPGFGDQVNLDGFPDYDGVDLNFQQPDEEYDSNVSSDTDIFSFHANKAPSSVRRKSLEFHLAQKRLLMQTRLDFGPKDLRHVLKRRMSSNDQDYYSSTFSSSSKEKRYQQTGFRHLPGRLPSKFAISNGLRSQIVRGSFSFQQRRHSRTSKPSQHFTGKRGKHPFKARKSKSFEEFSERREPSSGTAEEEFQGPKPLSDILKEKRMPKSEVVNGYQ